jgi:hypothetical protein
MQLAIRTDVESRLWAAHGKVNNAFRSYLGSLRREENRRKTVERRKAEKLYLDFIKASQRFYRGFIQRICSHFADLTELHAIAQKMHLDNLSVDTPVQVDAAQKQELVRFCHLSLIRCGDLSRYREIELGHKERNWGPAKGYYECAVELAPTSGHSFNQLSVMALADSDHFRALYYLYRSLAMPYPFESAAGNLALELKKLRKKTVERAPVDTKLGACEIAFLKLHGMCYGDDDFPDFRHSLQDVMLALVQVISAEACNNSLLKVCLINIAASHHALKGARDPPPAQPFSADRFGHAWKLLQSLNIATFITCLHLFDTELRGNNGSEHSATSPAAQLGPVCRRVLPPLRLYTSWLLSDLELLHEHARLSDGTETDLSDFWSIFAQTLNTVLDLLPIQTLHTVPYLLDEDEDTLHFVPISEAARDILCSKSSGGMKPVRDKSSSANRSKAAQPEMEMEMLARVKDLVRVGLHLFKNKVSALLSRRLSYFSDIAKHSFGSSTVPLHFGGKKFFYESADIEQPSRATISSKHHVDVPSAAAAPANVSDIVPESQHTNKDFEAMHDMVDDLVGVVPNSTRTPYKAGDSAPAHGAGDIRNQFAPTNYTVSDLVRQMSQHSPSGTSSTPVPLHSHHSSFGIYQTPFMPFPGELPNGSSTSLVGSRPGTAHNQSSPRTGHFGASSSFSDDIAKRQRALEERSSPLLSMEAPTMSSTSQTSNVFHSTTAVGLQARSRSMLQNDQWPSSPLPMPSITIPDASPWENTTRRSPAPARFGAIGDSRPSLTRAPTSGQPG